MAAEERAGRVRGVRAVAALAALVLGGTLVQTSAAAAPSEQDVETSRQAERTTSQQIAALEVELASVAAQAEEAGIRAQLANEEFLEAEVALEEAIARAEDLQEQADAAAEEVEAARAELGQIGAALYRDGSGSLNGLTPYLSAQSFSEAMAHQHTLERLGSRTAGQVQHYEALQQVHSTLQGRADEAVAEQQEATDTLEAAAEEAQGAARAAETQVADSAARREQLIDQLAEQRQTTVELERERQESLEAERREREENAAREAALAAERAADQEQGAGDQGRGAAGEEPEGTSSPPPSGSSSPSPTRTSSPSPTQTSSPSPTRTSSPSPTRTSSPSPTRTQPPAPNPTPTQPPPSTPAPPPNTSAAQTAINWARTQIGKPYGWGAAGPNSYDCSGLTMRAYQQAGINLPRTSRDQFAATRTIPISQLQPGDLVFWSNNGQASGIYHVAIYTGNGMRLHAPSPGSRVEEVPMWHVNIFAGGRVG